MTEHEREALSALIALGAEGLGPDFARHLEGPWHRRDAQVDESSVAAQEGGGGSPVAYDLDDQALTYAAMAAMLLGQPLILAGEPGVGKTRFAAALAERLELTMQSPFQVKSSTAGTDLFYIYDDVARFRDAVGAGASRMTQGEMRGHVGALRDYVRFNALGRAILWSAGPDTVVPRGEVPLEDVAGPEHVGKTEIRLGDLFPSAFRAARAGAGERIVNAPERTIALIDELDKAPNDAPNDILAEIEDMRFRIPELDITIAARAQTWPILFITSNSERSLPDAFLRRCVFHWIDFPAPERLARILSSHCVRARGMHLPADSPLVRTAVELFGAARAVAVNKPPATAELIAFVLALLNAGYTPDQEVFVDEPLVQRALGILLKTRIDFQRVREELGVTM